MVNALPARHKPGQGFFEHAGSKSRRGIGQVIQNFLAFRREIPRARKIVGKFLKHAQILLTKGFHNPTKKAPVV